MTVRSADSHGIPPLLPKYATPDAHRAESALPLLGTVLTPVHREARFSVAARRVGRLPSPAVTNRPDVLVVGGGTAGAVVAGRLVEAGIGVTIMDAGPDYGPWRAGGWPEELLDARRPPELHNWGYAGPGADGHRLAFDRARVIGGCSSHNGCAQSWGWRGDYDRWGSMGCAGWSANEVLPSFHRATERMRVRRYETEEIQPFQAAFIDAAAGAGVSRTDDLDDLDGGAGVAVEPVNAVDGVRWNTSFAYLDPVRERRELTVVGDALVDRVLFDGTRAVGVGAITADGREEFHADLVVLSSGAYGTPEVLLRSGIGPARELRALDIDVVADVPGVGRGLQDQPAIELAFHAGGELADALDEFAAVRWLPEEQAIAKLATPQSDGPFDLHVYPWAEPDPSSRWRCVLPVALLTPASRGAVRLRSSDPTVRAEIDHRYLSDDAGHDLARVAWGLRWIADLAGGRLAAWLGTAIDRVPDLSDDAATEAWIRSSHGHYWHPGGTCRMDREGDPHAVVDRAGRVAGVSGLRVADASIFPSIPRATPALPTVVIGERMADMLIEE
jgi:choline dehydrogenase